LSLVTQDAAGLVDSMEAGSPAPPGPGPGASLLAALAYADLFDYPLTLQELARYQVGTAFPTAALEASLQSDPMLAESISRSDGFYSLRGREGVFETRRARRRAAGKVWRRARLYARLIARLPYVRMVAVTGALAVDNIAERPDIDLMIVARPGRVWLCRRSIIVNVRAARLFGDDLCPNYILSEDNLHLDQRDFFTAHELAQMVPLHGTYVYHRLLHANPWANGYLPQAFSTLPQAQPRQRISPVRSGVEALFRHRAFDGWERWELQRLQAKLRPSIGDAAEVVCSPAQCKGHTGFHRQSVMARYRNRLQELGLYEGFAPLLDGGANA
jgi:hypothetical protein